MVLVGEDLTVSKTSAKTILTLAFAFIVVLQCGTIV